MCKSKFRSEESVFIALYWEQGLCNRQSVIHVTIMPAHVIILWALGTHPNIDRSEVRGRERKGSEMKWNLYARRKRVKGTGENKNTKCTLMPCGIRCAPVGFLIRCQSTSGPSVVPHPDRMCTDVTLMVPHEALGTLWSKTFAGISISAIGRTWQAIEV